MKEFLEPVVGFEGLYEISVKAMLKALRELEAMEQDIRNL